MRAADLSPRTRHEVLAALPVTELDVLVIGGGVVGAGVALDAASRGLSTAVVEAQDWAGGTSSRSSKLVHGGLRYLEMLDVGLVREALRERGLLHERLAPHLVRPVSFLYPLKHRLWERAYVGAGVLLYDTLACGPGRVGRLPRHRHLGRRAVLRSSPGLRAGSLVGAIEYHDAQVDDARLTLGLVRTAVSLGAMAVTRVRMVGLVRDGARVVGAELEDTTSGRRTVVRARAVVNATGAWTDRTHEMVGTRAPFAVRASKGVHVVVPRDRIALDTGLILRTPSSVLFVIPWDRHWLVGTTDTDWSGAPDDPVPTAADVDYLLAQANRVLRTPVTRDDVVSAFAGLRPLVSGGSDATADLSREHTIGSPAPGLVTIAGGKLTTYRVMAEDAVDAAVAMIGRPTPASCTDRVPLVGAHGWAAAWNARHVLAVEAGLGVEQVERLMHRYGTTTTDVLALGRVEPALLEPVPGTGGHLGAEIAYAVRSEGAMDLDDVLARRTRVAIETRDRGVVAAPHVARIVAPHLGWDTGRVEREVTTYVERVDARLRAEGVDQVEGEGVPAPSA